MEIDEKELAQEIGKVASAGNQIIDTVNELMSLEELWEPTESELGDALQEILRGMLMNITLFNIIIINLWKFIAIQAKKNGIEGDLFPEPEKLELELQEMETSGQKPPSDSGETLN